MWYYVRHLTKYQTLTKYNIQHIKYNILYAIPEKGLIISFAIPTFLKCKTLPDIFY